jgi:N-acyl-phosphatidylethanolamine-hydrolysing phospholipase D
MPPDPAPGALRTAQPAVAWPAAAHGELRITWIGHATFLIQLPGITLLTDPIWSERASPVSLIGTKRFVPAIPPLEELPPIDAVLISHDHYDHLDRPTVRALHRGFGDSLTWYTPLGYRGWFRPLGIERVVELDWWENAQLVDTDCMVVAAPVRHWTRRTPWGTNRRLWCSWAIVSPIGHAGPSIYFGGDSGYASFFSDIGERLGPFAASMIPIGAYEPRWFMGAAHMDPEEAVRAYRQLGGRGVFVPSHWGTFRLTFEDPLEPPERLRHAWDRAGLDGGSLAVLRHGETLAVELDS